MRDNSFGVRSEASTQFSLGENYASAVAVQTDGKIVAAGYIRRPNYPFATDFALLRYDQNGIFDNSFGSGGKVLTSFGYVNNNYNSAGIYGLALQSDGKIIAAGYTFYDGFVLVRYNGNGSIDTSFGVNGKVITRSDDFIGVAKAVTVQPDGKIIAVGSARNSTESNGHTAIVRYNIDGSLDNSFGGNGKVVTATGYASKSNSIIVQPDAKIVVGGDYNRQVNSGVTDSVVLRYNSDGTLDSSFGVGGKVVNTFGETSNSINGIARQTDGKIITGGLITYASESFPTRRTYPAIVRYKNDGSLDQTFGTNGTIIETNNYYGFASYIYSISTQVDNKIVAAGFTTQNGVQVFRYNSNGTPDESFGVFGRAFSSLSGTAYAVAIQPDGKIVTAGIKYRGDFINSVPNTDFMVTRFLGGPGRSIAKYDFDGDGKSDVSVYRPSEGIWYLNQSTNGMVAARFGTATDKPVAADYDGDGKTDVAVYRSGTWYLMRSQAGFAAIQFGSANDIPLPADFDDDGKAELIVYRPSNGTWHQLNLTNNVFSTNQFGQPGDLPYIHKINNSEKPLLGLYRNGKWLIASGSGPLEIYFGTAGDIPVPEDYDGDGRTDFAVFRPSNGTWYHNQGNSYRQVSFGFGSDVPVPADYDGDGKTDISVFRNGTWYLNRSAGGFTGVQFGTSTDLAIPNSSFR